MDPIYYVIITILLALAVSDLVVGVSNDAVNFLNSALGSKAAPRWVIMAIASVGILAGAVFSSGMMEVARNGIFVPGEFNFHSVMMIFLAVMFTDVILLDMFNTLGLPTSTTVSLVFELLGSAVAVALVNIWSAEPGMADSLSAYINSSKAMGIISGILISVVISFTTGMIVMFITRLIFSFRYKKSFKYIGALWCGVALTAISYFAVFKGLKGTTLFSADFKETLDTTSTMFILVCSFGFWTVIMAFLQFLFRLNILKLTVLAGTFSLALAFAGNDLVNFIGVFMAGNSSFEIAKEAAANGVDLSTLKMTALAEKVQVNWMYLFAAGAIMTVTLWFSKKARKVTETEINLARQDSEGERFGSSLVSRALVRSAINLNKGFIKIAPSPVQKWISKRFEPVVNNDADKAPFDLIRATVNLSTASILIAMATSLKLPLSTTYVTFMVAMGSSLSDRAWGRETAVYRITGVLTVISGWFMTAFIAFTIAFIVALVLMYGGTFAIAGMACLCVFLLARTRISALRKKKQGATTEAAKVQMTIIEGANMEVCDTIAVISSIYDRTIQGLFDEDFKALKKATKESKALMKQAKEHKEKLPSILLELADRDMCAGHYYVQVVDYLGEVAKSLLHITRPAREYIENNHQGFSQSQINDLREISNLSRELYGKTAEMLRHGDYSHLQSTEENRVRFANLLKEATDNQIQRVVAKESGSRSSMLYLTIVNETKILAQHSSDLFESQKRFAESK